MQDNQHYAQTMGAISGILSAFAVFVVGGGLVLLSWVSDQEAANRALAKSNAANAQTATTPAPQKEVEPEPLVASSKPVKRAPRTRSKAKPKTSRSSASAAKVAQVPKPAPTVEVAPTYVLDVPPRKDFQKDSKVVNQARRSAAQRASQATPSTPSPQAVTNPNGRGTVIIMGDATRVRLIGSRGTFGAGALPSGSYTIQATFEGDEPRMAGTVEVGDGERVRIVCIAGQRQCSRR